MLNPRLCISGCLAVSLFFPTFWFKSKSFKEQRLHSWLAILHQHSITQGEIHSQTGMSCQSLHKQKPLYTRQMHWSQRLQWLSVNFSSVDSALLFENFCNSNKCKIQKKKSSWDASNIIDYIIAVAMETLGGTKSSRFGVPKNLLLPFWNILQLTIEHV